MNRCVWRKLTGWIAGGVAKVTALILAWCAFCGVIIWASSSPLGYAIVEAIGYLVLAALFMFMTVGACYGIVMNISDAIKRFKVECNE